MSKEVKLYRFNPATLQLNGDYKNAKKGEYLIALNSTTKKTNECSKHHLEDIQLFYPNVCNLPPIINNSIEVKPNITTGSSLKRNAMIFLGEAITGIITLKLGCLVSRYVIELIKNMKILPTTALETIISVSSSLLGKATTTSTINEITDHSKVFGLPSQTSSFSTKILTAVLVILTLGMKKL